MRPLISGTSQASCSRLSRTSAALCAVHFKTPAFAWRALVAACVAVLLIFAMQCVMPAQAQAKSYECPRVVIDATLNNDGSLSVTEQRTFDFDGSFTAVWWTFDNLPGAESKIAVDSVTISSDQGEGVQARFPKSRFSVLGVKRAAQDLPRIP